MIANRLAEESESDHIVILDVPLLVESGRGDTAGVIVVGHSSESGALYAADGYPVPMEILSAATPALRFFALIGCHEFGEVLDFDG